MGQAERSHINPVQIYRPPCSKCGAPTTLARIEPALESGHDLRTFECTVCGNGDVVDVAYRAATS
jgi:hypothetical protein